MHDSFVFLGLASLTFLLAGFVKGAIGLGFPTVGMGLLALVMSPARAAALLVVPSLVTNIWQVAAGPDVAALLRRLWPKMLGICVGTWVGPGLLTGGNTGRARLALGAALALYGVLGLASVRFAVHRRSEPWLSPLMGAATGLVTAATGVFSIPAVPYLEALGLEKEALVQALGLSFTVSTLALGASLARNGAFQMAVAAGSLLALGPALAGMLLGQWVRSRVRAKTFRVGFLAGLVLLGSYLALRSGR